MKKIKIFVCLFIMVAFLTSCGLTIPISATSNEIGSKVGKSTATSILFFPPLASDKASIQRAAKNGGITKISTVDYSFKWFVLFSNWTTTLTGE